jgi:tetraacyldisaccharide 4'-kinase
MKQSVAARLRGFVDSTDRSFLAVAFRTSGLALSVPCSLLVRVHHRLYDLRIRKSVRVPCPTISIGNVTMGGVGKSPFVAWLTEYLIEQGRRPGLISRGYKSREQASQTELKKAKDDPNSSDRFARYQIFNDEAREFVARFPSVPYFLGRDRVEVADALLRSRPDVDVVVLDDAFQHRKIARDLNVVLLDALNPFGGDRLPPSGFLREPTTALARADVILLNRADLVDVDARKAIRKRVLKLAPGALWGELAQRPRSICRRVKPETQSERAVVQEITVDEWQKRSAGSRVLAFCGLGAPAGFRKTLNALGLDPVAFLEFPDHCLYDRNDLKRLADAVKETNAGLLLTTMKDFVKFNGTEPLGVPLDALTIGVEFLEGREAFCQKTLDTLANRAVNR